MEYNNERRILPPHRRSKGESSSHRLSYVRSEAGSVVAIITYNYLIGGDYMQTLRQDEDLTHHIGARLQINKLGIDGKDYVYEGLLKGESPVALIASVCCDRS